MQKERFLGRFVVMSRIKFAMSDASIFKCESVAQLYQKTIQMCGDTLIRQVSVGSKETGVRRHVHDAEGAANCRHKEHPQQ